MEPRRWPTDEIGASNPIPISVGVASSRVLDTKGVRKSVTFINDSPNIIYLAKGKDAVLNGGYRLNANGGSAEDVPDIYGRLWKGAWFAIATVAASNLIVIEDW